MSRDHEEQGVSPAEADRLRALAGRLDDEDFARVDPPADLWGRIAAAAHTEPVGAPVLASVGAEVADADADADDEVDEAAGYEVEDFGRLRAIARRVDDEDRARVDPPADLWRRIAAAVEAEAPAPMAAPVVSLDAHRRRRHRRVLAAVAAAVVVVAVTGAVLLGGGSSPDGDETQLVASTELDALEPIGGATAEVRLVRQDDHLQLELDAHDMAAAPEGQHYELWLLDPSSEAAAPVSLGAMTGSTSVPVPAGVDPDEYAVVDVSLQEQGQTEHSGHSLLRGTLA